MRILLVFLCMAVLTSCGSADTQEQKVAGHTPAAFVSKNSDAFNKPFEQLLTTYYALKDAFVEYDTLKVNSMSKELAAAAGGIRLNELKNDSSGAVKATALDFAGTVKNAAGEIAAQPDFKKKQRAFQAISDAMYELVRTVKYDRQKIYHQHCPMAFENEGAYWISSSNQIVNPYMGKKHSKYRSAMLECGDIPDSLNFSRQ